MSLDLFLSFQLCFSHHSSIFGWLFFSGSKPNYNVVTVNQVCLFFLSVSLLLLSQLSHHLKIGFFFSRFWYPCKLGFEKVLSFSLTSLSSQKKNLTRKKGSRNEENIHTQEDTRRYQKIQEDIRRYKKIGKKVFFFPSEWVAKNSWFDFKELLIPASFKDSHNSLSHRLLLPLSSTSSPSHQLLPLSLSLSPFFLLIRVTQKRLVENGNLSDDEE